MTTPETTPEDRILNLALEEVVGARHPPDLRERILTRTTKATDGTRTSRWTRWIAASVAAAVLVGIALWMARPSPAPPAPVEPPVEPPLTPPRTPDAPTRLDLTDDEKQQADEWIALLREQIEVDLTQPESLKRLTAQWKARRSLLDLLDNKPEGWSWVRDQVVPLPPEPEQFNVRVRLIEILGRAPDAGSDTLIVERLATAPIEVDEGTLLVLAERGSETALAALEERVAAMPRKWTMALPAAFLALRGDTRGERTLRWFRTAPKSIEAQPAAALVCAHVLERLGDTGAWSETSDAVRALASDRLAEGDLSAARYLVASFSLVRPLAAGESIRLGDLDRRAQRRSRELREELDTAESIGARLAQLGD